MANEDPSLFRGSLFRAALGSSLVLSGCSHDWDAYDPRLGTTDTSTSGTSASSSTTASSSGSGEGGGGTGGGAGATGGATSAYAAVVLSDGPAGYWRLGEASGPVAN